MLNNIGLPGLIMLLAILVFWIYPFWRLLPKFGYSKWLSLVVLIPIGAVVLIWILAFSEPRKETV